MDYEPTLDDIYSSEITRLRKQNRVLWEALKAWMVYYEGHSTADNRDRAYFMTRAALTATSQPGGTHEL